jgi:hypothetical protein
MGASICCAEAEADTQFTIFDLSALKKQCLIYQISPPSRPSSAQPSTSTLIRFAPFQKHLSG